MFNNLRNLLRTKNRYYHSDEDNSRVRIVTVLQGQKDLNPRHAVLEAMLKFISRSNFSPILGICRQPRRGCFKN